MKQGLLIAVLLLNFFSSLAQDKSILARIAYEDAETAFAANKIDLAWSELNKVDSLLGKITPKSQYLRIQLWRQYATINPANLEGAIQACKRYLDLAETNNLPEEKVLDITRLMVQLQNEKALADKKAAELAAATQREKELEQLASKLIPEAIRAFDQWSIKHFGLKIGEPFDSAKNRRESFAALRKGKIYNGEFTMYQKRDDYYSPERIAITCLDQSGTIISLEQNIYSGNSREESYEYANKIQKELEQVKDILKPISTLSQVPWQFHTSDNRRAFLFGIKYYYLKFNGSERMFNIVFYDDNKKSKTRYRAGALLEGKGLTTF